MKYVCRKMIYGDSIINMETSNFNGWMYKVPTFLQVLRGGSSFSFLVRKVLLKELSIMLRILLKVLIIMFCVYRKRIVEFICRLS